MIRHTLQGYYSSKLQCSQVDSKQCLQNFDQNLIHKLYPIVHYSIPLQVPHWSIDLVEAAIDLHRDCPKFLWILYRKRKITAKPFYVFLTAVDSDSIR